MLFWSLKHIWKIIFFWSCLQKYELNSWQAGSNWKVLLLLLLWIPKQQVSTDPMAIYDEDVASKIRQKKFEDSWIDKHLKGQNSAVMDVCLASDRKYPSQAFQFQKVGKSDVWLTVRRNSVWIKKPARCHCLYSFFLF
jgi:hypothetical protein